MNERALRRVTIISLLVGGILLVFTAEKERREGESFLSAKGFGATTNQRTYSEEENQREFQNALITKYSIGGILVFLSGLTLYIWKDPTSTNERANQA